MTQREISTEDWIWEALGAVLVAIIFSVTNLRAQVDTGTILGTVKDQTGAVVPNASVTLTNKETGHTSTKKTAADGSYVFTPIKIGTYTVIAESAGFEKTTHADIGVSIQQQVVVGPDHGSRKSDAKRRGNRDAAPVADTESVGSTGGDVAVHQ